MSPPRPHKRTGLPCTVLFVDVCGSTELYARFGNARGLAALATTLEILSQVALHHLGTIIKKIGDGVLCTFPTAADAAQGAAEMHRAVRQAMALADTGIKTLAVRVGFHSGPVISRKDDVFGDAVNVAARLVGMAKPGQTIIAKETVNALSGGSSVRFVCSTEVKGKTRPFDLFEVIWDHNNLTVMRPATRTKAPTTRLTVAFGALTVEVGRQRPVIHMGRAPDNEIVVPHAVASRVHARIEYRRGRFVLVDQSLNGTYLNLQGGREVALRREEMALEGSGLIGLGASAATQQEQCVRFAVHGVTSPD
jgi:adenylate cyclase